MLVKPYAVIFCLLFLFVRPAFSIDYEHFVYGHIESFTWIELEGGERLLKESGPLLGIGYTGKVTFIDVLALSPRAEVFGGQVDYDGQTQSGIPVTSDTNYLGLKTEADLGLRLLPAEHFALEPFIGMGLRWWRREIENTTAVVAGNVIPVQGVVEYWRIFYGRLGLRGDYQFSTVLKVYAEATMKLPIDNEEKVDEVCTSIWCGDVNLEPGKSNSYYAEAGIKYHFFEAALFYETMRFSKSDTVSVPGGVVWQPESEADMYGINIGWSF